MIAIPKILSSRAESRDLRLQRLVVTLLRRGASMAQFFSILNHIAFVIDAFATGCTSETLALIARKFPGIENNANILFGK